MTNENNLFDTLISDNPNKFTVTYNEIVSNPNERYRTGPTLRDTIKKRKLRYSHFTIKDNTLYAIYSTDPKKGTLLTINNSEYMDISRFSRRFADRLKDNTLTFSLCDEGENYMILKLPLRTTDEMSAQPSTVKLNRRKPRRTFTDEQIDDINRKYHINKATAYTLATQYDVSVSKIYSIVKDGYKG